MADMSVSTGTHEQGRRPTIENPELHSLEDGKGSDYGSKVATPQGSSASIAGTTNLIATGDINEFTMYQKFRLKVVEIFGSVSSALYEFGADAETGEISRCRFEEVCTGLNLLTPQQANLLFSHVTNADPMDLGVGGVATSRHFSVSDAEWAHVVDMKRKEKEGNAGNIPFASGPFGRSAGIYHRPIQVAGEFSSIGEADHNTSSGGPFESKMSLTSKSISHSKSRSTPSKRSQKPYAWRQKQKPWAPSLYAGEQATVTAEQLLAKVEAERGRPNQFFFQTAGRAAFVTDQPKFSQLGSSPRQTKRDVKHLTQRCPPTRPEMEPRISASQVDAWWPYSGKAPPRKLPIALPRCKLLEAQLSARA